MQSSSSPPTSLSHHIGNNWTIFVTYERYFIRLYSRKWLHQYFTCIRNFLINTFGHSVSINPETPYLQSHHVTIKTVYKQWQPPFLSLVFYNVDRSTRSDRHSNVVFNSAFPANTSQLINTLCSTCDHLSSTIDHRINQINQHIRQSINLQNGLDL